MHTLFCDLFKVSEVKVTRAISDARVSNLMPEYMTMMGKGHGSSFGNEVSFLHFHDIMEGL